MKKVFIIAPNYFGIDHSIANAFRSEGFDVCLMNYRDKYYMVERIAGKISRLVPFVKCITNMIFRLFLLIDNRYLVRILYAEKPNMIFIVKGENIMPSTIMHIKEKLGIPCISYQWDDPFYSYEEHKLYDDYRKNNFLKSMKLYSHIFIFDKHYISKIKNLGINKVSYLPLATDANNYRKLEYSDEEHKQYSYDVCFVGIPFPNRIKMFDALKGFRFGVFGDKWDSFLLGRRRDYYRGKAKGEKVLKLYCSSKIILNIHHPQSVLGVNTRTFDILACEAFEIVDYKEGIEDLFKVGEEIVCYKDASELQGLIDYYLLHPEERKKISHRGFNRVMKNHTWKHRIQQVMKKLDENNIKI